MARVRHSPSSRREAEAQKPDEQTIAAAGDIHDADETDTPAEGDLAAALERGIASIFASMDASEIRSDDGEGSDESLEEREALTFTLLNELNRLWARPAA
jgi:hypothetical protein